MINKIQNSFSIQDLEILSGIKAHTIRIWEKRFGLLNPSRVNRNIRVYDLSDLQKMLNVSVLQRHNFKISEISKLEKDELEDKVKLIASNSPVGNTHLNKILVSMFSLDESLFEKVYLEQLKSNSFSDIFINTYIPLMQHIGLLWQTNRIKPVQEHFISNLVCQKIILNTSLLPDAIPESDLVNVLFLPEGEIHEIGLLFLNYYLKLNGQRTIYLGRDIPMSDLFFVNAQFGKIHWICAHVIERTDEEKEEFIHQMNTLLTNGDNTCQVIGEMWGKYKGMQRPTSRLSFHSGFEEIIRY